MNEMDKHRVFMALMGVLAAPITAFAGTAAVNIAGSAMVASGNAAGEGAYFGLKEQEDLFTRLRDKVIEYWTPNFNGFNARVGYASDRDTGNSAISSANPGKFTFSLSYDFRQISAFLSNDRSWGYDSSGLEHSSTDLGGLYAFSAGTRFGLGLEQHRYGFIGGGVPVSGNMKIDDWYVALVQDVGTGGHVRLSFTQADNGAQSGLGILNGANQISVGYGQTLSTNTEIYALYTRSQNNFATNPFGFGLGLNAIGLGVKHSF